MGKLISIEGNDGSGKNTQSIILVQKLCDAGYNAKMLSFPRYQDPASTFVKRYLNGDYSLDPNGIDPIVASNFYAMDRYDCFHGIDKMIDFYNQPDSILVCDRYTNSNLIHQVGKVPKSDRQLFIDWVMNWEFHILKIPQPDLTIFLNMPVYLSLMLMEDRGRQKDIHETEDFLTKSYETAVYLANRLKWSVIRCESDHRLKPIPNISEEIFNLVSKYLVN